MLGLLYTAGNKIDLFRAVSRYQPPYSFSDIDVGVTQQDNLAAILQCSPDLLVSASAHWVDNVKNTSKQMANERFKAHDHARVAPGGDEILALLKVGPHLILLDEVLQF